MGRDRGGARRARRDLRLLLNEWDPIGVFLVSGPVDCRPDADDEYDCIRDGILRRLRRGSTREDVAAYLRHELDEHFGMPDEPVPADLLDQLFVRWASVGAEKS